jgi:hypothetical protein
MEYSTGKRVGVVGITVAILMLALISQTYPSASASRVLFHGSLIKSQILSPQVGIQLTLPKIVVFPPNIDPPVSNLQTLFKHQTPLQTEVPNSHPLISIPNTFPSEDFVKRIIEKATGSSSGGSSDNSGGSSSGGSSDNSGGSSSGGSSDNSGTTENVEIIHHSDGSDTWSSDSDHHHNSLDVQDKSFLQGIKITDVDRSNPHLLKVTLERHSGNLPKYVAVVAVGKDGQTIAGSTTIRSDDISNTLTVNVVLKNKNDKNGHLDTSADVIVWVVPAALSL